MPPKAKNHKKQSASSRKRNQLKSHTKQFPKPQSELFKGLKKIDRSVFKKLVEKHHSDKDSWTHLVSMLFCYFAKSTSVRDISNGLRSATGNLNHLGVIKAPSKSSISYQNKHRTSDLFKDLYYELVGRTM